MRKDSKHSPETIEKIRRSKIGKMKPVKVIESMKRGWHHTLEAKEKMRQAKRPKMVIVDGVIYTTAAEAARVLKVTCNVVYGRVRNAYFPTWNYYTPTK